MNLNELTIPKNIIIKIKINECRKLIFTESTDTPSPYVVAIVKDEKFTTQVFYDQQNPVFATGCNFSLKLPLSELKYLKIIFEVWHKNPFYKKDIIIGQYAVDAYKIYGESSHEKTNLWGMLDNNNYNVGSISLDILVISEGDKTTALIEQQVESESGENNENQNNKNKLSNLIIGKPLIEVKTYLLQLVIFKGEFAELPGISEINSKVRIILQTEKIDTITKLNSKTPTYRTLHNIPIKSPFNISFIVCEIIQDEDTIIGRFIIDFNILVKDGILEAKWINFYGPERDNSSFITNLKYKYEMGTEVEPYYYSGKILLEAKLLPDENATKTIGATAGEITFPTEKKYTCWIDIYELSSIKIDSGEKIYVEIQIGSIVKPSGEEMEVAEYDDKTKKFCWENKRMNPFTVSLPEDESQCPDVFLRVFTKGSLFNSDKKNYLAYKRFSFNEISRNKNNILVKWETLRKTNTSLKGDTDENMIGLILCSVNIFTSMEIPKRPIIVPATNFKKYRLFGFICMGSNLVIEGSDLPNPLVEISFNGKTRRVEEDKKTLNPVWNKPLQITTTINENLELSDKIKMKLIDNSAIFERNMGNCEIDITSIKKYNNKSFIDKDLYKEAEWYSLYQGTEKLETKILAIFFIVKLVSLNKETIELSDKKMLPDEEVYRLYLYILGIRDLKREIDLNDGYVIVKYYKQELEKKVDKTELFKCNSNYPQLENYYSCDLIGNEYCLLKLANFSKFIKNLQILIYDKSDNLIYTAILNLEEMIEFSKLQVNSSPNASKEENKIKFMKKEKKVVLHSEEIIPLYKEESMNVMELYRKTMESFPTDIDEINNSIGEETFFDNYVVEVDRKGKTKDEDDVQGKINRPELDYPYEEELQENELPFKTINLQQSGCKDYCGILRYIGRLVNENDKCLTENISENFTQSCKKFSEMKPKDFLFSLRLYLLNITFVNNSTAENGFVWIKRFKGDMEYKDIKRPFKIINGEINSTYEIDLVWPDTFFLIIEIYHLESSYGITSEKFIGKTVIDLEKRYFHPSYENKLKNHKKFKQIPIENRTIFDENGKMSQGAIRMWLEIIPKKRKDDFIITSLSAQIMEKYELRMVIWNTNDIPRIDGSVNIQVKVSMFDGKNDIVQETDTHNKSKDGVGEFNWRIVIPFYFPSIKTNMNISVFNDNLISKDEIVSFVNLNLKDLLYKIHKNKNPVDFPRQWLALEPSPQVAADNDTGGEIEVEMKILTFQEAETNPVGKGQEEPNKDPYLEKPTTGRELFNIMGLIKEIGEGIADFAGGFMFMVKIIAVIGSIAGIAYFIKMMVS